MRTSASFVRLAVAAVIILVIALCMVQCVGRTDLQGSRWTGGYEEFVADVGTATVTMVLEFTSGKDFTLSEEYSMPAHPATYVNPDGSVDMIPGRGFRSEYTGTYRDRGRGLVLSMADGTEMELRREDDSLVGETPFGEEVVFRRGE